MVSVKNVYLIMYLNYIIWKVLSKYSYTHLHSAIEHSFMLFTNITNLFYSIKIDVI